MTKIVAMLVALTLAACGSASTAGPKTSNPPLKKEPPKADPAPPAQDEVEVDGFTLKIKPLEFRITMTTAPWQGKPHRADDGQLRIILERPDLEGMLFLGAIRAENASSQAVVETHHAALAQNQSVSNLSAVTAENGGRYAFTADGTEDGKVTRVYVAASPHPTTPGAYVLSMGFVPAANADAFLKDVRASLDTIAPL